MTNPFENYDDPARAAKVFREYVPNLRAITETKRDLVEAVVAQCRTVDDLDIGLDNVLTGHSLPNIGGGSPHHVEDADSNGSWSNVVSSSEE